MMYNGVTYKNEEKQRKCSNNQWCTTMDNKKYGGVKKKYLTPQNEYSMITKVLTVGRVCQPDPDRFIKQMFSSMKYRSNKILQI